MSRQTWDAGDSWLATMRHIAKEAAVGDQHRDCITGSDLPDDFPERDKLFDPENGSMMQCRLWSSRWGP